LGTAVGFFSAKTQECVLKNIIENKMIAKNFFIDYIVTII